VEKFGTARQGTDENIIGRTRIACWVNKATDIYSEHVILTAAPRQQCVRERAPALSLYVQYSTVQYSTLPVLLDPKFTAMLTRALH
jgi:hypothetical protein